MKKYQIIAIITIILGVIILPGCGKKDNGIHYEIVDGQIVQSGQSVEEMPDNKPEQTNADEEIIVANDYQQNETLLPGEYNQGPVSDGVAMNFSNEEYNSISNADSSKVSELKKIVNAAADACKQTYADADKGEAFNVTLSNTVIAQMVSDVGSTGVACIDSLHNCNMASYESLDEFGQNTRISGGVLYGTYLVIYPDGHITGFMLCRENNLWHLLATSGEWDRNNSFKIFSEGRYSVGGVKYTDRGWLIYSRNTSDFDENQKKNTDEYTMVKVLPYDSTARALSKRYIEPVSYFENNLFVTNWSEANMGPIDFNSLYAYIFGMYNGTDMLSSYNVRNYYKAYRGTRLYVVPTETFENNTQVYFNIDSATLKNISDYSYSAGGYFFLGYNRDYFNVTPRTPSPEIISYSYNSDGTITMTVAAVNPWYGTDTAFTHILTVRDEGNAFKYVSNQLIEDENNIIPEQKLAEMLDVEKQKLG